jgi:hypothetical protein
VAVVGIALASAGVAQTTAKGVSPGTFGYKLHDTVPLLVKAGSLPQFQRTVDTAKLSGISSTSQAGAHADTSVTWVVTVPGGSAAVLDGTEVPSNILVKAPPGIFTNFDAVPSCSFNEFDSTIAKDPTGGCRSDSQVGVISALFGGALPDRTYPLYKLVTEPGELATFGYPYELLSERVGVIVNAELRTGSDYGITLARRGTNIPEFVPASFMTFWGVPADSSHDPERWNPEKQNWGASVGTPPVPLMSNASNCNSGILEATLQMSYWSDWNHWLPDDPEDLAYRSFSPEPVGCEKLTFNPSVELSPSVNESDSSSGISMQLNFPRNPNPSGLETPPLKDGELSLPGGMSINPATANGLAACSPEQIGLQGSNFPSPDPIRFSVGVPHCPDASKVGIAVISTPLVEGPVKGEIYVAAPYENPFRSLLALYLVFNGPSFPVIGPSFTIKLAARVAIDPTTGQITVVMNSLPQLPVENVSLKIHGGPRGLVSTPPTCGRATAETRLVPWSAPQSGPPATLESDLEFSAGPTGTPCRQSLTARPFSPKLIVGTRDAVASIPSSFILRVDRADGDQELKTVSVRLPRGLAVNTQGIAYCSEIDIEHAEARDGAGGGIVEQNHPSCPADSKVGSLAIGVGTGSVPLFVKGSVYLAGPYKGAPLSLVAISPALAGGTSEHPLFDLGAVVDRIALMVDPRTAQITARSDQIPRTLSGIPLRINDIRMLIDHSGFIRSPSSCNEMRATADIEGVNGAQATLANRFQLGDCARLGFQPRLQVGLTGGTKRGQHPQLKAVLNTKQNETAIARARLTFPRVELLDQGRLTDVCTKVLFAQSSCPRRSEVGYATVWSPFLGQPLKGPVSLRSSGNGLPDLVLSLEGPVFIEVIGKIRLTSDHRIQITFTNLPDIPLEGLTMTIHGGRGGLLINSRDLCIRAVHLGVRFTAHNGKVKSQRPSGANECTLRTRSSLRLPHGKSR